MLKGFRDKHMSDIIKKNAGNSRVLFTTVNKALHRNQEAPLPPHDNSKKEADEFNDF